MPRSDVSAGLLTSALTVLIGVVLNHTGVFDFTAVEAAFATVITFAAGWYAGRYKPLVVAVVAPVASLATAVAGLLLFEIPIDQALLSNLIATIAGAILTYRVPPFDASPLDPDTPGPVRSERRVPTR